MKKWGFITVFTVFMMLSVSCQADEPIYIGLSVPMTGQYATYGDSFKKAVELAIDQVNKAGGINGRSIGLMVEDSQGDPRVSKRIARKFIKDNRIVVEIGDFTSTCSMAAAPIYRRGKMVQLSPTASHPSFAPGSPYSFSVIMNNEHGCPVMAQYVVKTLHKKKIAMLYINNDWGIVSQRFFTNTARQLGATIVSSEPYFEGTRDFSAVLQKIRAASPELLFTFLMTQDGVLFNKQRENMGWNDVALMGSTTLSSPQFLELGGKAVEGIYTFTTFFSKDPKEEVRTFIKAYELRYHQTPGVFAARAYDAVNLLAAAMKKGGTNRESIRESLTKITNFPGVTGKITFNEQGSVMKELLMLQVRNGEFVLYSEK